MADALDAGRGHNELVVCCLRVPARGRVRRGGDVHWLVGFDVERRGEEVVRAAAEASWGSAGSVGCGKVSEEGVAVDKC